MGLIVNVPEPEGEVSQVVADVAQNGIIRGSKEYNKDEYITGAELAKSSTAFPAWDEDGKVFYKIKQHALDPRNFKDSNDVGTLTVRYVVQPQGEKNTVLRIDAVYVEDFRKTPHFSNGSVESSEYRDIQDRLAALELMKKETLDAEREKQSMREREMIAGPAFAPRPESSSRPMEASREGASRPDPPQEQTLEQHVHDLRTQVERKVKAPGAPLKSAPYQTALTLKALPAGTEVLLVISTTYWYGVETHEGDHGWLPRVELEPLP